MNYGRYQIVKEIGKGSMGVVYEAYDPDIDRHIALKVLREDRVTSKAFVDRFLKEAKAIGRFSHSNVVTVYDVGQDHGTIFIAMELVEGKPLDKVIQERKLTIKEIVDLAIQVAEILECANQKGIVHRDIKPSNIILMPNARIKITDFGIAHIEDPSGHQLTQAGEIIGTPAYMAPEQVIGCPVDGRSDLFSLGSILYEITTGSRPFQGNNIAAIFNSITQENPVEPVQKNPEIPKDLSHIIMKCLKKSPEERFQTGGELYEALKQFLKGSSIQIESLIHDITQKTVKSKKTFSMLTFFIITIICIQILLTLAYIYIPNGRILVEQSKKILTNPILIQTVRTIFKYGLYLVSLIVTLFIGIFIINFLGRLGIFRPFGEILKKIKLPIKILLPSKIFESLKKSLFKRRHTEKGSHIDDIEASYIIKKPEYINFTQYNNKEVIEDLILHQDLDRIERFILESKGGRILLTGYGSFGGTSLTKGAIRRAREDFKRRGDESKGALLVFYYDIIESDSDTKKFKIKANKFSIGTLTSYNVDSEDKVGLFRGLKEYSEKCNSNCDASGTMTFDFSLSQSLDESFLKGFRAIGNSQKKGEKVDLEFDEFILRIHQFFTEGKDSKELQRIVSQLIESDKLQSRVIIILDRIQYLTTLESLTHLELFNNEHFTIIAISRKEDFDLWKDSETKLEKIGFEKWYIPCLWQTRQDFVTHLKNIILKPVGIKGEGDKELSDALPKHLEFWGKGIFGNVLKELRLPKYWSKDENGNPCIRMEGLSKKIILHDAWMQDVLTLNWSGILGGLFAGRTMDEKEDRAKISIYHLIDWITDKQIFTKDQLLMAAHNCKFTISENIPVLEEVTLNLLDILLKLGFLRSEESNKSLLHRLNDLLNLRFLNLKKSKNVEQYRVSWDKSSAKQPRKVCIKKRTKSFSNSKEDHIKYKDISEKNNNSAITLCYSYSHKDEDLRDSLDTHLETLKDNGIISSWHDRCITPGTQWHDKILLEFEKADIILLLVSSDFLASKFCKEEMRLALQYHNSKKSVVIPIIVRPADWCNSPLAKLQVLPTDAKPVITWEYIDEAWIDVMIGIRKAIEKFKMLKD